jgi:hypothetical protein
LDRQSPAPSPSPISRDASRILRIDIRRSAIFILQTYRVASTPIKPNTTHKQQRIAKTLPLPFPTKDIKTISTQEKNEMRIQFSHIAYDAQTSFGWKCGANKSTTQKPTSSAVAPTSAELRSILRQRGTG